MKRLARGRERSDHPYPVTGANGWPATPPGRLEARFYEIKRLRRRLMQKPPVLDRRSGRFTPLKSDDLPLICVVHNAIGYIRSFLRYYRGLGVTRFLFIDDSSDDGTREVLEAADDVDLYTSSLKFTEARELWRDALIAIHGRDRWYLSVDADEFLVFPGSETRPIRDFIADLERAGLNRCLAPMIDLYPELRLGDGLFVDDGTQWPFEVSTHFDTDGYGMQCTWWGLKIHGGPRKRLFGTDVTLSKFPLLKVDRATDYRRGSIHFPAPFRRNFGPATAVLLHYKFSSNSVEEFRRIIARGNHHKNAANYRAIVESGFFLEGLSLAHDGSARYAGSEDLVDRGFIIDVRQAPARWSARQA